MSTVTRNKTRKRASRKPDQFALLFQNNPLPMLIYDLGTLRLEAIDAAVQHYGYSRAKFRNLHIGDISSNEAVARIKAFARTSRQSLQYSGKREGIRKDDKISFIEITSCKLVYRRHKAAWIIVEDSSESNQSQGSSVESEQKANERQKHFKELQPLSHPRVM